MDKKSYKVLFADDEYWTREKIRKMIQWEEYSLIFQEPAEDGEDVLEKIKEDKPDILITDIHMPFLNGVELLNILHTDYPEIVTFVISGHNDFDYVKNTFMAGAINYLIKPITKVDLVNALSKAMEIISTRQSLKEEQKKQRYEILKASSLIQDKELSMLIKKEDPLFTSSVTMQNNMDFAGTSLMLIKIHDLNELAEKHYHDLNVLSFKIKKELKKRIDDEKAIVFNHIYRSNEFIIVTELEQKDIKKAADKIRVYFASATSSPVTVCISEHSYTLDSVHAAYVQAVSLLMTRKFNRNSEIISYSKENNNGNTQNISGHFRKEYEKQLKGLLKTGNKTAVRKLIFRTIGLEKCRENQWNYLEVKQTVKRILNIFSDYVEETGTTQYIVDMDSMSEMADKAAELLDEHQLCEIFEAIIDNTSKKAKEDAPNSIRSVVKQAVKYIDIHYNEYLTLSSLAEHFNVESSYFSKVFSQETGENLMLYITKKRMDKARDAMRNDDINLTEIAFMVGYDDYTYFSRVFRKITGMSPRDYRSNLNNV